MLIRRRLPSLIALGAALLAGGGNATAGFGATELAAQTSDVRGGEARVTGMIRGRFLDGVRSLPYAVVDVRSADRRVSVVADGTGRYTVENLGAGDVRLRVTHPGHDPVELTVRVPARGTVAVDLELTAVPMQLEAVDVTADLTRPDPPEAGGRALGTEVPDPDFEVQLLEISPALGEAGMIDAVQAMPGNDPADPSDVLFMRGSTAELKLVLLDGVPVFTPFHVAGLMRSFEPAVLGSAQLHVGGAPARYDGGLTHILDLRTRSARRDRVRGTGSVDLLSASAAAELPLGSRAGVIASGRSLHGLGQQPLGGEPPYGYRDVLVTVDGDVGRQTLRATGFWNEESVRLDFSDRPSDARWRNSAAVLSWSGELRGLRLRATGGGSEYAASLPLQPTRRPGEPMPAPLLASATSERARATIEAEWGSPSQPIRAGLSGEEFGASFSAETLEIEPTVQRASTTRSGVTRAAGAFVDVTRQPTAGVTLRLGIRGDVFSGDPLRLAPRVSLAWEASPNALLTVAAGRYHQVARAADGEVDEALSDLATPVADELLPVATADHVVLGLDQDLGRVDLGIQGFWKRFEGLGASRGERVLNSGLDLRLRRVGEDALIWVGYGLSWFWSPLDLSGRSSEFAGRHLLSAGLSRSLGGPLRGEFRFAYGAGLPSTSISFGSAFDAASPEGPGEQLTPASSVDPGGPLLEESFLRIDLEIHALFEPEWGPRAWRVRPYLRVLNALDRRDALFYTYQPWRSDSVRPLAERAFLPIVGVAFSF